MREVKDPEVRKAEIIEAARNLFYTKGYLQTTTQDIIEALNISRGLLYYHFKSKEEILYFIVEKHIEPIITKITSVTYHKDLSAKEKVVQFLNITITSESSVNQEDFSLQEAIQLPENTYMMDSINHKLAYIMSSHFGEIVKQGNEEGVFQVKYPEELSAFLWTAYPFVGNDPYFHHNNIQKATGYLNAFKQMLNQTLGLEEPLFP